MANPPFDASKAVTFDLSRGQIQKDEAEARLLVSAEALLSFCHAAGADATAAFGRAIGDSFGSAVARRFERTGSSARAAAVESVVDHLAGELALGGFGALSLERWGRALVLVVDGGPGGGEGDKLLAPLLAAAVSKATKTEARCVRLSRDGNRARFLITGAKGADQIRGWLLSGVSWGEALVRLHPPAASGGGA
jgi:hypothetical protein